jgi:hypothetical protein
MKVVPVTLDEGIVAQIDVLGPRSSVIRRIVEEYCAERAARGIAIAAATRQGGDVQQAPCEAPQSGGEAASPNPVHTTEGDS